MNNEHYENLARTISFPKLPEKPIKKNVAARPQASDNDIHIGHKEINDKHIIYNRGHGGAGWTVGHATVNESIKIFQKLDIHNPSEIAVVGGGVIGLYTAISLKEKFQNATITIYHKKDTNIASYAAAALLALTGVEINPKNKEYAVSTYKFYKEQIERDNGNEAIFYQDTYYEKDCDESQECYSGLYKGKKADISITNDNSSENKIERDCILYEKSVIYIDTHKMMEKLKTQAIKLGIKLEEKEINSFCADIGQKLIFDCAGIANIKEHTKNNSSIEISPCFGHALYYNVKTRPNFAYLSTIILLPNGKEDIKENYIKRRFQFIPKNIYDSEGNLVANLMIGGTSINRQTNSEEDEKEYRLIEEIARYKTGETKEISGYKIIESLEPFQHTENLKKTSLRSPNFLKLSRSDSFINCSNSSSKIKEIIHQHESKTSENYPLELKKSKELALSPLENGLKNFFSLHTSENHNYLSKSLINRRGCSNLVINVFKDGQAYPQQTMVRSR